MFGSENTSQPSGEELRRFAHDLRNGLGAIYTYAQLLEHSLAAEGGDAQPAQAIVESVQSMNAMITERVDAWAPPKE